MAIVYLARDIRHKRPVALKVLHPDLGAVLGTERFLREIETAARLQHPHILTVLDSGEAAARLWFTMPYVEGESLRDRLRREKQLPVDEAVRITREAAQALDYAHRHGVIHRDIKPENLLLTEDGNTLVADFGSPARSQGGDERAHPDGLAVGTPAYMSPEQASGARDLDARTDVYALAPSSTRCSPVSRRSPGPPRRPPSPAFHRGAPPLRQCGETVPEAVEQAVRRALAKAPADRFPSAAEFARALNAPAAPAPLGAPAAVTAQAPAAATPRPATRRRVPAAAVTLGLGILIGLGVLFGWLRSHGTGNVDEAAGAKRVAVLPFENLGPTRGRVLRRRRRRRDPGQAGRAARPPDHGLQQLGRVQGDDEAPGADRAGTRRRLPPRGQGALAEGQQGGQNRVEVRPELVQVADRLDQVAGALRRRAHRRLPGAGRRGRARRPGARRGARCGRAAAARREADGEPGRLRRLPPGRGGRGPGGHGRPPGSAGRSAFYEQAVALDSAFALAWAQLSRAQSLLYANSSPSPALGAAARLAAERALALAPDRPESYLALCDYYGSVRGTTRGRSRSVRGGSALEPGNADLLSARP